MERSETIKELALALSKAQGEIKPALKDSDNPFFKSKYADLAAVWEVCRIPLSKNGLTVMQHPTAEGSNVSVETLLIHSTGEWVSSKLTMIAKDATPQAIGSLITYGRRYSLSSIIGIASELDDDGNAASGLKSDVKKGDLQQSQEKVKAGQSSGNGTEEQKARWLEMVATARKSFRDLTGDDEEYLNNLGDAGVEKEEELSLSDLIKFYNSLNVRYRDLAKAKKENKK